MKTRSDTHLTDDDIVMATVERDSLPSGARDHLLACVLCREKVEGLRGGIARLAKMAREMVPQPAERPQRKLAMNSIRWLRPVPLAVATATICLMLVAIWGMPTTFGPFGPDATAVYQSENDDWLLAGLDGLVKDSLPGPLGIISPDDVNPAGDRFLLIIAPLEDQGDIFEEEEYEETIGV